MNENLDQKDVVAMLDQSRKEVTRLREELAAVSPRLTAALSDVAALTSQRDEAVSLAGVGAEGLHRKLVTMTAERDSLRTSLSTVTSERDAARTELKEANTKLAGYDDNLRADLLKFGVRKTAITLPEVKPGDSKMTVDEQVAAHKATQGQ